MYISLIEIDAGAQTILETREDTEPNRLALHKRRLKMLKEKKDVQFVATANRPEETKLSRRQRRKQKRTIQKYFEKIERKKTYEEKRKEIPRKIP